MTVIAEREQMSDGWFIAGQDPNDYEIGIDSKTFHSGGQSGYIKDKVSHPRSFATLMQIFKAATFHGQRIRMRAFAKSEDIEDWAGLWMRVDGPRGTTYQFDNMEDRPIRGTSDWQEYEIILDVPDDSENIAFGILLSGKGQIWVDDFSFKPISTSIPTTDPGRHEKPLRNEPINLSFE